MTFLKRIFDFYLESSIHVALSCFSLVLMTHHVFGIYINWASAFFAFFGTIAGYNFVKYDALARIRKKTMGVKLKSITILSFFSFLSAGFCFLNFGLVTQISGLAFLILTVLYTLPFFPNRKNARNWAGVKIYMVAVCWVGISLVLPVIESGIGITSDFYLKCIQRFLLIFILILIFEIIDLKYDDPHLKTVPQQIGVKRTKITGLILLALFYFLEFLRIEMDIKQLIINAVLVVATALFLVFAKESRSRYYTAFWVEMIPVLWWLLVLASE
jgi:hypothetical protein